MQRRAGGRRQERRIGALVRGQRSEAKRQVAVLQREQGVGVADDGQHGLAAKARHAVGEHRLIAHVGKDREGVVRYVDGGEHVHHAGPAPAKRGQVADLERRMRHAANG